jgi:hypothetical protein
MFLLVVDNLVMPAEIVVDVIQRLVVQVTDMVEIAQDRTKVQRVVVI